MPNIIDNLEDFNEQNDRIEAFSEIASANNISGHSFLHSLAIGLAPLACAIDGAMLCLHLIPKMYKHMQKNGDFEQMRLLSYRTLFAIPVTILGIAAIAIGGMAAAVPLGIASGVCKTIHAGFELANNPHPNNQAHQKPLRERLCFNLFGAVTLIALVAAPPVGAVMGLVGLALSVVAIGINTKNSIQQTGFSGWLNKIKLGINSIISRNRAPILVPQPEPAAVIHTQRQADTPAEQSRSIHEPPHAASAMLEQHPELQGEFKPKYKPTLETIAEASEEDESGAGAAELI